MRQQINKQQEEGTGLGWWVCVVWCGLELGKKGLLPVNSRLAPPRLLALLKDTAINKGEPGKFPYWVQKEKKTPNLSCLTQSVSCLESLEMIRIRWGVIKQLGERLSSTLRHSQRLHPCGDSIHHHWHLVPHKECSIYRSFRSISHKKKWRVF